MRSMSVLVWRGIGRLRCSHVLCLIASLQTWSVVLGYEGSTNGDVVTAINLRDVEWKDMAAMKSQSFRHHSEAKVGKPALSNSIGR